ncbi:hypothetical protein WA026_011944 [Henosepilachna vigintioctopunctata]|uniref:Muscle-specific protein n=1 Tax=Henosepilachna vigintioctopunctata TaxID=420089 RepID=A0AAW1VBS7_9CUCU
MVDSLEDKRAVLEQFQLHLQTLFDWQSELDRLNMKAQVLLETCSDTRISNGVTQLATKYGTVLALAKEIMRRLELHYQEHQQHSTLCQECQDWLDRTKEKLNSCHEIPNILSEINNKLQILKNIRTSIEQGQNKLRYILELKERVIVNTEQSGAEKIEEVTENLKQDIEKLLSSLNEARNKLTVRGSQLEEIEKLYKIISEVLDDIDHQSQPQEEYLQDLGEKKSNLEKFKTLYKELKAQNELVEKLKTKLNENDVVDQSYRNCIQRYDKMVNNIEEMTQNLEKQVAEHQQYKNMYEKTTAWIKERQTAVQNCTNLHAELEDIEDKEHSIDEIIQILPEGEDLVHSTIEMSILVLKSTGAEGQDIIKQDIDELNNVWEGFQVLCTETKKSLVRCKEAWIEFNEIYNEFERWIKVSQKKLDDLNKKEKHDTTDLSIIQDLLSEINEQKENLETLTDACDLVMGQSAVGWVRDKTVELQNNYTVLLTNTQDLLSKIEKSLSDHNEFLLAKSNLEQWLFKAHSTIQECVGVGDEKAIEEKLQLIAQSVGNMGEGQELLSALQEAFAKAINVVPIDQQESLRTDVSALRNSWDQLNLDLTSIQAQLKAALNRWKEYNDSKQSLMLWLSNTEDILDEKHSTRGEYSEMKTLLERYKNLGVEIANKRNNLDRFKNEAIELGQWSKIAAVSNDADQIQSLYENLLSKCNRNKENVEAEIRDYMIYQQSLQEVEKWLLQTSFKLMNQNALYITNKEQTENQLREQESTINEIQKFQMNLDDVRAKGQKQINQYIASTPAIEETIGKQLNNVQDSFNSLLKTALQIKNRLLESLSKFKEYEATLEDIMKNLDEYEPKISEMTDKSVNDLEEGQIHLEIVKVRLIFLNYKTDYHNS